MLRSIQTPKIGLNKIVSTSLRLIAFAIVVHQAYQIVEAATIKQEVQKIDRPQSDRVAQASDIFGIQPYGNSYEILGGANGATVASLDTYADPMKASASK